MEIIDNQIKPMMDETCSCLLVHKISNMGV
jgi:hypothetical protein